jgi:hypothetical protein
VNGLDVTDLTDGGHGTGTFSQEFSDAFSNSGSLHIFTPLTSSATSIDLSNGDTLTITPELSEPTLTGGGQANVNGYATTAMFSLTPTATLPEPSSAVTVLSGLGAVAFRVLRKRRIRP